MRFTWLLFLALSNCFFCSIASAKPAKAHCKNPYFWRCYGVPHTCPPGCPKFCQVDCKICKPYCACDKPGAVCQDPRFIGGDGIMFYFHGRKDKDFCLVTDAGIHINGHFIGKNNRKGRDFTWVQSIGVLFGRHRLFVGARKVSRWHAFDDNIHIQLDGADVEIPSGEGAVWESRGAGLTIERVAAENDVVVEVTGLVEIRARVVPITAEESRVHGYDIAEDDDCFAHLELSFKLSSPSPSLHGILGQTYAPDYRSRVKNGAAMPIMGGEKKFSSSHLFATDCAVSRFGTEGEEEGNELKTANVAKSQ
ncbi:uncharacterized protein LOC135596754 [Musa acuminata AAA Group]|uniref:uncharacterized protein LOC135596754 n=1 Tax=Musa acuminata AAA Group TaxID=214697 RepID=UPI0031DBFD44